MSGLQCWAVLGLAWMAALTCIWAFMAGACDTNDMARECVCGHARSLHEHMHERTFCAICPSCLRFRPARADVQRARSTPLPSRVGEHVTDIGEEQLFDQDADDRDWDAAFDDIVRGAL